MSRTSDIVKLRDKLYAQADAITEGKVDFQEANALIKTSNAIVSMYRLQLEAVKLGSKSDALKLLTE